MVALEGTPSDEVPDVLATGRTDITTIYISMSTRHPEGRDAEYLEWHSLDHRPEQYRLAGLRASLRVVSTPACRAARAVSTPRYDAVDHVMTYMFAGAASLRGFVDLGAALHTVERVPGLLPMVERGVYELGGTVAAPRVKVGADVMPWWPARGLYLLVELSEDGAAEPAALAGVEGIGGAWWMAGVPVEDPDATGAAREPAPAWTTLATPWRDRSGLQVTYCFLDGDPPAVAERLRPYLEQRWSTSTITPLLAAPFHTMVPYEWDRHLP